MAKKMMLEEILAMMDPETRRTFERTLRHWVDRDDGIAVYENQAFDSANHGHRKFVSFGSHAAQLEVDEPPERLPDIGNQINWAYMLVGTYRRCCERGNDGDGDCYIHVRRGETRRER